jgi:hypothetical protein
MVRGVVEVELHHSWLWHEIEVVSFTPRPISPTEKTPVLTGKELGCAQELLWTLWRDEFFAHQESNPRCRSRSPWPYRLSNCVGGRLHGDASTHASGQFGIWNARCSMLQSPTRRKRSPRSVLWLAVSRNKGEESDDKKCSAHERGEWRHNIAQICSRPPTETNFALEPRVIFFLPFPSRFIFKYNWFWKTQSEWGWDTKLLFFLKK